MMRTARRLFLVAAAALLVLAPGCFGTGGAAPPASSPTMAAHGALSTWLFAQGGIDGHRFSNDAAVTLATLPSLGQAWAAQTRGAVTGTPTVQDGHVFVATWKGMVYCLKVADGSIAWSRDLGSQVDGSVTLAPGLALVGDAAGRLHALDAATGKDVWVRLLDEHLHAHLYATPLVVPAHGERPTFIVQAVGSDQESARIHGDAPIDFRGHVTALAMNGTPLWQTYLVPPGQTGAPVWGTPVYDAGNDRIVFGTGNAYTEPSGELTDSIVSLRAADGAVAWHVQGTPGDVFTQANPINPDSDFGATPILFGAGEHTVAGLGQKSSVFWAVDLATGAVVWKEGVPQAGEGIIGDAALAGTTLVVPYVTLGKVTAYDERNGAVRWERKLEGAGFADPVAVAGAVIVGDAGGWVHGLDVATGREVWNATVGGDGAVFGGLSVAEGMLFVPVVRDGFLADAGGLVAFKPNGVGGLPKGAAQDGGGGVAMRGFQFQPREIHVQAGKAVSWRNEDPELHTVTAADGSFDVQVPPGKDAQLRFDTKGTFAYYCKPHATQNDGGAWEGMTGTVIVE